MSKNEKMIGIAIGAYVLYQWWKGRQAASIPYTPGFVPNPQSLTPVWMQQLGETSATGTITSTLDATLSTLMNTPQGPGGTPQDVAGLVTPPACVLGM